MTDKHFEPGSAEWLTENRRRSAAGELPLEAPMADYRILVPSFVNGALRGGGEVVRMYIHDVGENDTHFMRMPDGWQKQKPMVEPAVPYVEPISNLPVSATRDTVLDASLPPRDVNPAVVRTTPPEIKAAPALGSDAHGAKQPGQNPPVGAKK